MIMLSPTGTLNRPRLSAPHKRGQSHAIEGLAPAHCRASPLAPPKVRPKATRGDASVCHWPGDHERNRRNRASVQNIDGAKRDEPQILPDTERSCAQEVAQAAAHVSPKRIITIKLKQIPENPVLGTGRLSTSKRKGASTMTNIVLKEAKVLHISRGEKKARAERRQSPVGPPVAQAAPRRCNGGGGEVRGPDGRREKSWASSPGHRIGAPKT